MRHVPTETETFDFAAAAHGNQVDAAGQPYIDHLREVARRVSVMLADIGTPIPLKERVAIRQAAILHDTIEDTNVTAVELEDKFGRRVTEIVQAVTRPNDLTYQEWIERIVASGDVGAMLVKLADNQHNADPVRVAALPPEKQGVTKRYTRSMATLQAGLAEYITFLKVKPK